MTRMTLEIPDRATTKENLLLAYPAVSASSASSLLIPVTILTLETTRAERSPIPDSRFPIPDSRLEAKLTWTVTSTLSRHASSAH